MSLLKVFNEIRNLSFSSITEPLKSENETRKTTDKAWLKILNYQGDSDELLKNLYTSISQEIKIINELVRIE